MTYTREELVKALRAHDAEIREAREWRPLADHVAELLDLQATDWRERAERAEATLRAIADDRETSAWARLQARKTLAQRH